jgi:hypothetical protein
MERNNMRVFKVSFSVLLVSLLLIGGCDSKPTHDSLMKENIVLLREQLTLMKTVTDETTARAAFPKTLKILEDMDRIQADRDKLGEQSEEEKAQLAAKYESELKPLIHELFEQTMRINTDPELKAVDAKLRKEYDELKKE